MQRPGSHLPAEFPEEKQAVCHGAPDLIEDVRLAVLETDSTISIVPRHAHTMRTRRASYLHRV